MVGEYEGALTLLEDVLSTCKRIGEFPVQARVLNTLGWLYGVLQDHHQAATWNMQGVEFAKAANFPNPEVESNKGVTYPLELRRYLMRQS